MAYTYLPTTHQIKSLLILHLKKWRKFIKKKFILALYFKYYKLIVFVLNTPFILKYKCYHTDYFVYYFIQIVKRCQTMSND